MNEKGTLIRAGSRAFIRFTVMPVTQVYHVIRDATSKTTLSKDVIRTNIIEQEIRRMMIRTTRTVSIGINMITLRTQAKDGKIKNITRMVTGSWEIGIKPPMAVSMVAGFSDDHLEGGTVSEAPLAVSFNAPIGNCYRDPVASVSISGSTAPYIVIWKRNGITIKSETTTKNSSISVFSSYQHSVRVTSSTSESWSRSFYKSGGCNGPYL